MLRRHLSGRDPRSPQRPVDTLMPANVIALMLGATCRGGRGAGLHDSLVIVDLLRREVNSFRSLEDSLIITDSVIAGITRFVYERSVSDALAITAVASREFTAARSTSDAASVADDAHYSVYCTRDAIDALSFTDSVRVEVTSLRSAADALVATDQAQVTGDSVLSVSDVLAATDSVSRWLSACATIADSFTVTDAASAGMVVKAVATDALSVTDGASRAVSLLSEADDWATITDSVSRAVDTTRTISESCSLTDSASTEITSEQVDADSLEILDAISRAVSFLRRPSDSVVATDSSNRASTSTRTVADSLVATDSASATLSGSGSLYERTVSDAVVATDVVSRTATFVRRVTDSVTVTDQAAGTESYPIPLGTSNHAACLDARHGLVVDGETGEVITWTSRCGTAVFAPPGNGPHLDATGSSTGGPTVDFLATNSECLTTTDATVIAVQNGDDLPATLVVRALAGATTQAICSWSNTANTTAYMTSMRLVSAWNCSRQGPLGWSYGTFTSEVGVAYTFTGTAVTLYCGGWDIQRAMNSATVAINIFTIGAISQTSTVAYLTGSVTALDIYSVAKSTADCDTALGIQANL